MPGRLFDWLERQCLKVAEGDGACWARLTQRGGRRAVQFRNFVGVIRTPDGSQIEVLPKIGRVDGDRNATRNKLVEMLRSLHTFRHIRADHAELETARMPLLELFIGEFLAAVEHVVQRGIRGDYRERRGNLFALRGKLLVGEQLRRNLHRPDRFFTEHEEFSSDRPENRLLRTALGRVLELSNHAAHLRRARELRFVFAEIPDSTASHQDLQRVRMERGMEYYHDALAWTRLLLEEVSPLTGVGAFQAPSLLYPMEAVFEAYVAKHLARQLNPALTLKTQPRRLSLLLHRERALFQLRPDLLIEADGETRMVLDTKWKLIDERRFDGSRKYGIAQADIYQLFAYAQRYLGNTGDVVLIYPKNERFNNPLPPFTIPESEILLWVMPFDLEGHQLLFPEEARFHDCFPTRPPDGDGAPSPPAAPPRPR